MERKRREKENNSVNSVDNILIPKYISLFNCQNSTTINNNKHLQSDYIKNGQLTNVTISWDKVP